MLDLMLSVLDNPNSLRRSNHIIHKDKWVQYPFENDLSKLPENDLAYCLNSFFNNPYADYTPGNMLQFFLTTFGEGITNTYLRPYNEKIWKYDPAYMNTSMVDRIPKPTDDEIKRSASGETVDGYTHQLHFSFPADGGIESVVNGLINRLNNKCRIVTDAEVTKVHKNADSFVVKGGSNDYTADILISTMPVQDLVNAVNADAAVKKCSDSLKYNSIMVFFVKTKYDLCGENFAFMIPDKDVIFHRISKMDFLGERYNSDGATYMVEITYRRGDRYDLMTQEQLYTAVKRGLMKIDFAESEAEIDILDCTKQQYAYVIYDVGHTANMRTIREYFQSFGIYLNGRFGNFEYWNMDRVLRESKNLCGKIIHNLGGLKLC
jgi:protoporphyrinogen oxidase